VPARYHHPAGPSGAPVVTSLRPLTRDNFYILDFTFIIFRFFIYLNPKSGIRNPKSGIRNQESEIGNQESEIGNQESEIRNPKSGILNPKS